MRRALPILLLLALCSQSMLAEVELLLVDGNVISGTEVVRKEGEYLLTTEAGDVVVIPAQLVASVSLKAASEPIDPAPLSTAPSEQLAGDPVPLDDPDAPASGVQKADPQVLAGEPVKPVTAKEATEMLGEPSQFQKGVVDPSWQPSSDWDMNPENNNFAPSTWSKSIVDNSWTPESDYTGGNDVSNFAPSTFSDGVIDNSWQPEDGFKKKGF